MNSLGPGQHSGAMLNGSCHFLTAIPNPATASEQNQSIKNSLAPAARSRPGLLRAGTGQDGRRRLKPPLVGVPVCEQFCLASGPGTDCKIQSSCLDYSFCPVLRVLNKRSLPKLLRNLFAALGFFCRLLLAVWATLAIYYSNLPWGWLRLAVAGAFAAFSIWALWVTSQAGMRWLFAGLFAALVLWEISIAPSNNRPWRRDVAVMPQAIVDSDHVRFTGVRDFDYRSIDDVTVRYIEREVSLSHLTSVDLFISYWVAGPVGHTFVSFNFSDAPPICISIESRPEKNEGYSPLASLFKQYELIYIVGEERDLVRVRTDYRNEELYLYRIQTTPVGARRLFLVYVNRINELADRPERYHLLKSNCTLNIVRYANAAAGRKGRFDVRHYLNGWVDRYLYEIGLVDTSLPFKELRRRSRINEASRAAMTHPISLIGFAPPCQAFGRPAIRGLTKSIAVRGVAFNSLAAIKRNANGRINRMKGAQIMKKNNPQLIAWEIVLLLASVFVFRGLWTLLDEIKWMSSPAALIQSLVIGVVLSVIAFWGLNRSVGD
jgi:Domain of unknown function (DUF4105)